MTSQSLDLLFSQAISLRAKLNNSTSSSSDSHTSTSTTSSSSIDDDNNEDDEEENEADEDNIIQSDGKSIHDASRCSFKKIPEKGIKNDLLRINISIDIVDIADKYYLDVVKGDIKRSNLRKGIMFACVFQAFKDLGKHQTPDDLQKLFKISRKTMSKGLTYFHTRSNKKSGDNGYITAEHFIPRVMENFNIKQEHIKSALVLYSQIKDKNRLFNSSNPQSVSCGLVFYYLKKINSDITGSKFGKAVGLSEITITRIANQIDDVLNS